MAKTPPLQSVMNQGDVLRPEAQAPSLKSGIVAGIPTRLHQAAFCVEINSLQQMDKLMRQHVAYKRWRCHGTGKPGYPIEK
jgi:hypothetical protein